MDNQSIRMKILREKYLKNMLSNQFYSKRESFRVRKRFYGIER